jgi:transcriptional regulator
MYVPEHFRESRIETLHALIRANSFGTIISTTDGAPFATHLPFLIDAERGSGGTLVGHMARANPHWHAFAGPDAPAPTATGESLVIFSGPHGYVSPSWYETPIAVPTWNYAAVHVYGLPRVVDDETAVTELLARTVDTYESGFEHPWRVDRLSGDLVERLAKNIVAFELPIARIEGKLKLSQNRSAADRRRVVQALQGSGAPGDLALAELMVLHSFPETGP